MNSLIICWKHFHFFTEMFCILIQISLKFVPKDPVNNKLALAPVMACCKFGSNHYLIQCLEPSPSLCKLVWRHWTYKMPVRYILAGVSVSFNIFSQLSIIQYIGLCVFSLPTSLVMIERIYDLSYGHHQIRSMNYYLLFRVRSWNNGMRCMSLYILLNWSWPRSITHYHTIRSEWLNGQIWFLDQNQDWKGWSLPVSYNVDGLVQESRNSIANTLELRLSCTNPSVWCFTPLVMKSEYSGITTSKS